jgi:hypothetical protein
MKNLYSSTQEAIFDVYEDEESQLYLVAICQGIAWTRIGVALTADETLQFRTSPSSLIGLARSLCRDFAPYKDRAISEAIQQQIIDLED